MAQVVMRFCKSRLQFQCPPVAGDCFGNLAGSVICAAEVVVEGSDISTQPDRAANVLDCDLRLSRLVTNRAEKMHCTRMFWLDRENLLTYPLGSLQVTGLLVLGGDRELLRDRGHRRSGMQFQSSSV